MTSGLQKKLEYTISRDKTRGIQERKGKPKYIIVLENSFLIPTKSKNCI